jgi:glycerol-3-phosphate acyltransferase PlsY
MDVLLWTALGIGCGSLMFAYWIGRWRLGVDVRDYGPDRNPGAANLWRAAGSWRLGVPGALLDYAKALVPVALARYVGGIAGWELVPVALAPIAGHVFSPFLGFRGGKGVAATFGIWTALTGLGGPLALGITCAVFWRLITSDVALGTAGLLAYVVFREPALYLFTIWAANTAIILWKTMPELEQSFNLRSRQDPRPG